MVVGGTPDARTAQSLGSSSSNCQAPYSVPIFNPLPFAITLDGNDFKLLFTLLPPTTSCDVTGTTFNVGLYQSSPLKTDSTTVGYLTGKGKRLVDFMPSAGVTYTLAPNTTSILFFAQGPAGYNAIPVLPGGTGTDDTSLSNNIGNTTGTGLGIGYKNGSTQGGANALAVSCFPDTDPRFAAAGLGGVYFPGKAKGACLFDTGSGTVTLGQTVTITIDNPDPDLSFAEFDGPAIYAPCNAAPSPQCTTSVPVTLSTTGSGSTNHALIFGNSQDVDACVPKNVHLECRPVNGTPSSNAGTAPTTGEYSVLISNDPTYTYDNFATFGLTFLGYTVSTSGGCALDLSADRNTDVPTSYADPDYRDTSDHQSSGVGSFASATFPMTTSYSVKGGTVDLRAVSDFEVDLKGIAGKGDCVMTVAELSVPQHKLVKDLTTDTIVSYP